MVPGIVLAASHEGPGNVDRRFPLDKAHDLRHRVLRRNGEEHMHVIRHQVPLFNATFLLLRQRTEDLPAMPPQLMTERFPTILRNKHNCSAACSWDPSVPVSQEVPASDPLEAQAIMVGRCLGRDDRRSTLPVRHHQAVIENASAVRFVGVESPSG
jgi:hypothetical protein